MRVVPGLYAGLSLQGWLRDDAEAGRDGVVTAQAFLRWALATPSRRY